MFIRVEKNCRRLEDTLLVAIKVLLLAWMEVMQIGVKSNPPPAGLIVFATVAFPVIGHDEVPIHDPPLCVESAPLCVESAAISSSAIICVNAIARVIEVARADQARDFELVGQVRLFLHTFLPIFLPTQAEAIPNLRAQRAMGCPEAGSCDKGQEGRQRSDIAQVAFPTGSFAQDRAGRTVFDCSHLLVSGAALLLCVGDELQGGIRLLGHPKGHGGAKLPDL
mmetsp:Transcript_72780/g.170485  ORF Transcript_72780/g.170485 Transcript_72780/m.170485 type:complete len:223 (+) Transcript_72780:662-1330(+)